MPLLAALWHQPQPLLACAGQHTASRPALMSMATRVLQAGRCPQVQETIVE